MPDGLGGAGVRIGVDVEGLRQAAVEHDAVHVAASNLADALRSIRLAPSALGSVDAAAAFASAVAAAAEAQADGAAAEAAHRSAARTSVSSAASTGETMVSSTTRVAQGVPRPSGS